MRNQFSLRPRFPWDKVAYGVGILFMAFCFGVLLLSGHACTNEKKARAVLEEEGYRHIEMTGWDPTRCASDDDTCDGFEAVSPNGAHVQGVVGCGYWGCSKACTVRLR